VQLVQKLYEAKVRLGALRADSEKRIEKQKSVFFSQVAIFNQ